MHDSTSPSSLARPLFFSALATLGLTAAHHVYGGIIYATPWRLHGSVVAAVLGLLLFAIYTAYRQNPSTPLGRLAGWTLVIVIVAIPVLVVGGFEGFYNHVVKNVLFLAGTSRVLLLKLFPPPTYELPNDLWFELSGVAQVIPAALAARAALRFVRALRSGSRGKSPLEFGMSR